MLKTRQGTGHRRAEGRDTRRQDAGVPECRRAGHRSAGVPGRRGAGALNLRETGVPECRKFGGISEKILPFGINFA